MSESRDQAFPFEPVPSASKRHDGWTPERQRTFIAALARIGVVAMAARAAGMSRKSAYKLRERAGPESGFARAWDEALSAGRAAVDLALFDRAVNGAEIPYYYRGVLCGMKRVYNDRLLIAACRAAERSMRRP